MADDRAEQARQERKIAARARTVKAAEARRFAVELRLAGASYETIGAKLGISKQAAHKAVMRALDETRTRTAENAERIRALEVRRLDAMLLSLWQSRSSPRVADTLIRLMDRRAKLLGLDAKPADEGIDPLTGKRLDAGGAPPAGPVTFRLEVVEGRHAADGGAHGPPSGDQGPDGAEDPEPLDPEEP